MRESLFDKYVDEHGFVDFGRSGGMSQQKEAKRFLSALNQQSELKQQYYFSISVCLLAFAFNFSNCISFQVLMKFCISGDIQFGR